MKILLAFLLFLPSLWGNEDMLTAPNPQFNFVDQQKGAGNSCGPASLLNAFGSGNAKWQVPYQKIPGSSDRARIASVIKSFGLSPSNAYPDRERWQHKGGVSFADLTTMAEEMRSLSWGLPKLRSELFFEAPSDAEKNLANAHKRLRKSLKKGFPPILSIRRFIFRQGQWQSVHGHFVVLQSLPNKLPRGSKSFAATFLDPIGAKSYQATIEISSDTTTQRGLPCLILTAPTNSVGKKFVRKGEVQTLGLAGAIGAW